MIVTPGSTNVVVYFMVRLVANGKAATGLTVTNFDLQYTRTLTAPSAKIDGIVGTGGATTYVDNKVFELDSVSSAGLYMVCFPDAAFAVGSDQVILNLTNTSDNVFADAQTIDLGVPVEIAKAVWNRVLTGATHNLPDSAGRILRQIKASFVVAEGTAQAGTSTTITLASGEDSNDDIFAGDRIVIVGGTGDKEHGIIKSYDGTTKICTMTQTWVITPDATSEYELVPADVDVESWQHLAVTNSSTTGFPQVDVKSISDSATAATTVKEREDAVFEGAVSGGTPTTTQFQTDLGSTDTTSYVDGALMFLEGPNAGETRRVTAHDGSGLITVGDDPLPVAPAVTNKFQILGRIE